MRILVNATTCVVGGGVQVSAAFIRQAVRSQEAIRYRFLVSDAVYRSLPPELQSDRELVQRVHPSPARLRLGRGSRDQIRRAEQAFGPDLVFTVFGPAYVQFRAPHLVGMADPWVTHASHAAFRALPFRQKGINLCKRVWKRLHLRPEDFYWVEAEVAQEGLVRHIRVPREQIRVISNTYSELYNDPQAWRSEAAGAEPEVVTITCIAAPYAHKNLTIIPEVARHLADLAPDRAWKFWVTLPEQGDIVRRFWKRAHQEQVEALIENLGPLRLEACPGVYARTQIVLMPTLLETMSATYPEAMRMGCPIVTTDLGFAREACGEAALYYEPLDARQAARCLLRLAEDGELRQRLVAAGRLQVRRFPTPAEKFRQQVDWLKRVAAAAGVGEPVAARA